MLRPYQLAAFAYVIPLASDDDCIIICIHLVLPMVSVDSPKFFCAFSETLTNVSNSLVHTPLLVPGYEAIVKTPKAGTGKPHTLDRLTHIEYYMDKVIAAVQGGTEQQRKVFDVTVRAFKWFLPSFPR